tara:strand:+ start:352 stop:645 length:294 start_codon:yes stop_codon:yes gene_type:complete
MRTKQGINDLIKGIIIEKGLNITDLEKTADRIIEALTEENNLFIPDVVASKRFTKTDLLRAYKAGCIENHEGVPITSMEDFGEISKNALEWVKRYTE